VDWFNKWPYEALNIVAEKFLADKSLTGQVKFPKDFLYLLVYTHTSAEEMCHRFLDELGRHYHVTSKSFLDFILLFKKIYMEKKEQSGYRLARLMTGLRKIEETNEMVLHMQDELISLGPILEQKTKVTSRRPF